jgi:hypothetical protein
VGIYNTIEKLAWYDALDRHYIDLTFDDVFCHPEQGIGIKTALAPKNRGRVSRKFGFYSKQLNRYNV